MKTETERLRAQIARFVEKLGKEYPRGKVARALVASACDISLEDNGALATTWMTDSATNLLAGHWSKERVDIFIESQRH